MHRLCRTHQLHCTPSCVRLTSHVKLCVSQMTMSSVTRLFSPGKSLKNDHARRLPQARLVKLVTELRVMTVRSSKPKLSVPSSVSRDSPRLSRRSHSLSDYYRSLVGVRRLWRRCLRNTHYGQGTATRSLPGYQVATLQSIYLTSGVGDVFAFIIFEVLYQAWSASTASIVHSSDTQFYSGHLL